jgi:hypothetical protein
MMGDIVKRMTGMEKFAQSRMVYRTAVMLARSDKEDDELRVRLEAQISKYPKGTAHALEMLASRRDSNLEEDRAYRLLDAAVNNRPVAAINPDLRDLFQRERELGDMAVKDAVMYIQRLEPGLTNLLRESHGVSSVVASDVVRLVGPQATNKDPLVRTQLALSVVNHYLAIQEGHIPNEDIGLSYFASPTKMVTRSGWTQSQKIVTRPTFHHHINEHQTLCQLSFRAALDARRPIPTRTLSKSGGGYWWSNAVEHIVGELYS